MNLHEDPVRHIDRLVRGHLYSGSMVQQFDDMGRLHVDDWELRQDVQTDVQERWARVSTDNIMEVSISPDSDAISFAYSGSRPTALTMTQTFLPLARSAHANPANDSDHWRRGEPGRSTLAPADFERARASADVPSQAAARGCGARRQRSSNQGGSRRSRDVACGSHRSRRDRPFRRPAIRPAPRALPSGDQHSLVLESVDGRPPGTGRPHHPDFVPPCRGSNVRGAAGDGPTRSAADLGACPVLVWKRSACSSSARWTRAPARWFFDSA